MLLFATVNEESNRINSPNKKRFPISDIEGSYSQEISGQTSWTVCYASIEECWVTDLEVESGTNVGLVHHTNEDSLVVFELSDDLTILTVCDGMGGMGRGDEASAIAVEVIERVLTESQPAFLPDRMRDAVVEADVRIRKQLAVPGNTPGSTAVLVGIEDGLAYTTWVGDSRAYLVRENTVVERTRDHKLVNELVDAGELTPQEAKNSSLSHVVTKALGGRGPAEPPIMPADLGHPWKLHNGDLILLCSDGLCDLVEDEELPSLLGDDLRASVELLIQTALDRGGHDNITVILARWVGADFDEESYKTPVLADRCHIPDAPTDRRDDTWDEEIHGPASKLTPEPAEPTQSAEPKDVEENGAPDPEKQQEIPWIPLSLVVVAVVLILAALAMST